MTSCYHYSGSSGESKGQRGARRCMWRTVPRTFGLSCAVFSCFPRSSWVGLLRRASWRGGGSAGAGAEHRVPSDGRQIGQGGDLVDDGTQPGGIVLGVGERGAKPGVERAGRPGEHHLGQFGDQGPLPGSDFLVTDPYVVRCDALEQRVLQPLLTWDDQLRRVSGEWPVTVGLAGGDLGGQAEPADQGAGEVFEGSEVTGGAVVAVGPVRFGEQRAETLLQLGQVSVCAVP